jgi:hypothetical protein
MIMMIYNYSKIKNSFIKESPEKNFNSIKRDELLEDLVEFTINSGFECMIIPDLEGKNTLFIKGEKNEAMPIVTIPITNSKKGSEEYNILLNQAKKEIEKFKELLNVKN